MCSEECDIKSCRWWVEYIHGYLSIYIGIYVCVHIYLVTSMRADRNYKFQSVRRKTWTNPIPNPNDNEQGWWQISTQTHTHIIFIFIIYTQSKKKKKKRNEERKKNIKDNRVCSNTFTLQEDTYVRTSLTNPILYYITSYILFIIRHCSKRKKKQFKIVQKYIYIKRKKIIKEIIMQETLVLDKVIFLFIFFHQTNLHLSRKYIHVDFSILYIIHS